MNQRIFVVIPTCGRPALLEEVLKSLARCQKPENYAGTVLLVNGPGALDHSVIRPFVASMALTCVRTPRPSKSAALNQILEDLKDSLLLFLDDDVRTNDRWMTALADAAECHNNAFFGGPVTGIGQSIVVSPTVYRHLPSSVRGWQWDGPGRSVHRPCFLGFNWAARCNDLLAIGGFNEKVGPGTESVSTSGDETEAQRRLLQIGCQGIYVPDALVHHTVTPKSLTLDWAIERAEQYGKQLGVSLRDRRDSAGSREAIFQILMHSLGCIRDALTLSFDRLRYDKAVVKGALSRCQSIRVQNPLESSLCPLNQ